MIVLQQKKRFGYSTRNRIFKRLEPIFQFSATRSASKEATESAVALAHSRECTKELILALLNYNSMGKFGARAELRNVLQGKTSWVDVVPVSLCQEIRFVFVGNATQV